MSHIKSFTFILIATIWLLVMGLTSSAEAADLCSVSGNASISGRIYLRDSTVPYSLELSSLQPLAHAIVSTTQCQTTADSAGNYSISLAGTGNDNFVQLTVTTNGFQTAWATVIVANDLGKNFDIGLYPTQVPLIRPGFVSGIYTHDAGGYIPYVYAQGMFETTYDRIKTPAGANLVVVSDDVWINAFDVASATVTMSKTSCAQCFLAPVMMTRDEYTRLVAAARSRNLAFMMHLSVYGPIPVDVDSSHTAFWDAWFAAYQPYVVEYAGIARDLKIEYLALGLNLQYMSSLPVAYWQKLVNAVRATGYTGKLVYAAQVKPHISWSEVYSFNGGTVGSSDADRAAKRAEFISLFDVLMLDIYNVAQGRSVPETISRDDMKATLRSILQEARQYPAQIMVMVGTPSVFGGAVAEDYIEPGIGCGAGCSSLAGSKQRDYMQQADVYQALYEVINETPAGQGNLVGVLSWGYWYTDNSTSYTFPNSTVHLQAYDKSASVRGKPSEAVMRWWNRQAPIVQTNRGWNLLGNSTNTSLNVAATFGDTSKVASVWKWNSANGRWAFFSPSLTNQAISAYAASKGYDVLTSINAGEGFWVNAQDTYSPVLPPGPAIPATAFLSTGGNALASGWNLVSTSDTMTPAQFVSAAGNTVATIWAYDNPSGKWYFYAPSLNAQGGTALGDYIKANSYLDFTNANKALGAGLGFWVNKP